ncbi:MAG: Exosortase [Pseudomonadota bacterium]|jgi:exosortase B|nr:Exosortase [Pseudomonadota bacterium]
MTSSNTHAASPAFQLSWLPAIIGLLALYLPTYYSLANGLWDSEEQAHGPIVLIVALYLLWQRWGQLQQLAARPAPIAGGASLLLGCLLYALGRSQDILIFEVGSQIPVLAGLILLEWGWRGIRLCAFPLFFLIFMVPLPGTFVDAATASLKAHVSVIAEHLLYWAGYPIARNGVVLTIGQYQLLVADACSGLHSMFSLSAMGLLYFYLIKHSSWLRNGILIAAILPMAFAANIVRVLVLVLVTYHFGNDAAQGFIHSFAGVLLFIVALLGLMLLDSVLGLIFKNKARASQ